MRIRIGLLLLALGCTGAPAMAQHTQKKNLQKQAKKTTKHRHYGTGVVVEAPPPPQVFIHVEQMPEFPGGQAALDRYLADNIRYPAPAREVEAEGTVTARFMVDGEGMITRAEILKDIGYGCGREVLRVIGAMPRWKPYKYNGRNIPCLFSIKVRFFIDR